MEISIFLAKVIGLYLIIKLVAVWANRDKMPAIMEGFRNDHALRFSYGLIMIVLGLLVVLSHNIWAMDYRAIITIIGWAVLLKGILISCLGSSFKMASSWILKTSVLTVLSIISIALATVLLYNGF